jgi:hypothetical protein
MSRITISYRRDDSLDITGRIFDRLAAHFGREAVFRDIDSIPPGVDFRDHIDQVLDQSDIILAIVGPRWIGPGARQRRLASATDPVRVEIETALRKNKPLIPVLVSHAVMPQPDELPDSLHDFAFRNAVQVDSGQDFEIHIGRLIRSMERFLPVGEEREANEPAKDVIAVIEAAPSIHGLRWVIGLGLVVIVAVFGTGGWWFFGEQPAAPVSAPIPFRCSFQQGLACHYAIYHFNGGVQYFTIPNGEIEYISGVSPNDLYCVSFNQPPANRSQCLDSPYPYRTIHPRPVGRGDGFN